MLWKGFSYSFLLFQSWISEQELSRKTSRVNIVPKPNLHQCKCKRDYFWHEQEIHLHCWQILLAYTQEKNVHWKSSRWPTANNPWSSQYFSIHYHFSMQNISLKNFPSTNLLICTRWKVEFSSLTETKSENHRSKITTCSILKILSQ